MKEPNDSLNDVSPTTIPDFSEQGVMPGKQHRKAGIYRITFEDMHYVIGCAGDLYAKINATVNRINDGVFPRYPKGTKILCLGILSENRDDLKRIKELASTDPKYMRTLKRTKKVVSATERYRKKRERKKKVNPLIEAHKQNTDAGSPLDRLRKQGGKLSTWMPPVEVDPVISSTRWIEKSRVYLDWDKANNKWRTRKPDTPVGTTTEDYHVIGDE